MSNFIIIGKKVNNVRVDPMSQNKNMLKINSGGATLTYFKILIVKISLKKNINSFSDVCFIFLPNNKCIGIK